MRLRLGLLGRDAYSIKCPIPCRTRIGEPSGELILMQRSQGPHSTCWVMLAYLGGGATAALTPHVMARVVCLTEFHLLGELGNEDVTCTLRCLHLDQCRGPIMYRRDGFPTNRTKGLPNACAKSHVCKAGGAGRGKYQTERRPIKISLGREIVEYLGMCICNQLTVIVIFISKRANAEPWPR